jgi:hypothetical protein
MTTPLRNVILVGLVLIGSSSLCAGTQDDGGSSLEVKRRYLLLDFRNNGQHLAASVGEQIEITLGAIVPSQYGEPEISSTAIRAASTALKWPPNPGGPVLIYIFEAVTEGEARVQFPFLDAIRPEVAKQRTFTVTIKVVKPSKKFTTLSEVMQPDQVNSDPWKMAWTSLYNSVVEQSFVPSLPRLTGVEVELVAATPGVQEEDVDMSVANADGQTLAVESKHVPVGQSEHVLFVFPHGGFRIAPGQTYRIGVSSAAFGWKYVSGGYAAGAASLNGQPLLANTRSTFLFRTFGTAATMEDPSDPALGTWILNIAKSRFDPGPAPRSEKRTYEAMPEGIKATIEVTAADGSGFSVTSPPYKQDGKPYALTDDPHTTNDRSVTAHEVTRVGSREYRITNLRAGQVVGHETMVVSKDGMVMTMTPAFTTASGQTQHDVRVFDRQ